MEELLNVVERCENRASVLGNKLAEVNRSINAVKESCSCARLSLDVQYERIKIEVMNQLEGHYRSLGEVIDKTKKKDIEALLGFQSQLQNDLSSVNELITKGTEPEKDKNEVFENGMENSVSSSKLTTEIQMHLDGLTRNHSDLPCSSLSIMVSVNEPRLASVFESLKSCIDVSVVGGLHITECLEMPGGVFVKWDEPLADVESVETDQSVISEYTLQYSSSLAGKANEDENCEAGLVFNTVYTGEEMQYLMNNVDINQTYYFRVCKSHVGAGDKGAYEPWSMSKKGWTTLPPYEWNKEDCVSYGQMTVYELGNNNRTATKVFPESCKVLRSSSASYHVGHLLSFNIIEAGERSSKDGIGLITKRFEKTSEDLLVVAPESIVVSTKGAIYVNGSVMVMKLPMLKRGSTLSFQTCQPVAGKLRVTIANEDKEVTFDWATGGDDDALSFASSFEHTGWQITVS